MTTVKIKNPCPEQWEKMKLGLHSRYCDNCKKDIIDFTTKTREEILRHILINQHTQVCGRLYPSQLDFTHTDILVAIQGLSPRQKNSNLPFYLLTVGTLFLSSCSNAPTDKHITTVQHDSSGTDSNLADSSQCDTKTTNTDKFEGVPLVGELVVGADTAFSNNQPQTTVDTEPYLIVDKMPEFIGGFDSLMSYLQNKITYPEWELKNKIQGTVYVAFIVDKKGKIKEAKIIRSVNGSKNFDTEVLNVINKMPDWTPGELHDKKVDVQYRLPVRFTL
jgi:TonB family protein